MFRKLIFGTMCWVFVFGCSTKAPSGVTHLDIDPNVPFFDQLIGIVNGVAPRIDSRVKSVRQIQKEFELAFFKEELGELGVRSHKWLNSYAYDATNSEQSLERFNEFINSAALVKRLMNQGTLKPLDVSHKGEWLDRDEKELLKGKGWCRRLNSTGCDLHRRYLYRVKTEPDEPEELYGKLAKLSNQLSTQQEKRGRQILVLGYEIPWDKDAGIRYGVTFYFKDDSWQESTTASNSQNVRSTFLGYEVIYTNEATPEPRIMAHERTELSEGPWEDNPFHMTGYPFALAIGLKNAVFEVVKMPFSFIAGALFGRGEPWKYSLQNLQTAYDSLMFEATTQTRYNALVGAYRLITEIPFVGQLFQFNLGSNLPESQVEECEPEARDSQRTLENENLCPRQKIFVSRGIYGGDQWGQDTGLWSAFTQRAYPEADVYAPPYRFGTVTDVVWSMFNLSHGPGYNEAQYVLQHAGRADRLYLAGHSGGVQRSAAASRVLADHGFRVAKVVGIAGPSIGQAFVDTRFEDPFLVYLNKEKGANQDVVSQIGVVANTYATLLDYAVIGPLKYTVGTVARIFGKDFQQWVFRKADQTGFTNSRIIEVDRKPSSRHQTPLRLSLSNRLVFDAYMRSEFAMAFREDLQWLGRFGGILESSRPFEWRP